MRYVYWLIAAACIAAAVYFKESGFGDPTTVGWTVAGIGWAMGAYMVDQAQDTLDRWKEHASKKV